MRFTGWGEINIFLREVLLSTLEYSTSTCFDRLTNLKFEEWKRIKSREGKERQFQGWGQVICMQESESNFNLQCVYLGR